MSYKYRDGGQDIWRLGGSVSGSVPPQHSCFQTSLLPAWRLFNIYRQSTVEINHHIFYTLYVQDPINTQKYIDIFAQI